MKKQIKHKGESLSVEWAARLITPAVCGSQMMYRLVEALSRRLDSKEVEYVLNLSPSSVTEENDEVGRFGRRFKEVNDE